MGVRTRGASGSLLRDLGDLFHAHGPRLGTLPGTLQPNDHTLRDLQWLYLKLLIARQHLLAARTRPTGTACRPTSWRSAASSVTRRFRPRPASPTATLALKRRAENVARRRQADARGDRQRPRADRSAGRPGAREHDAGRQAAGVLERSRTRVTTARRNAIRCGLPTHADWSICKWARVRWRRRSFENCSIIQESSEDQ
jgi:hypothetical protein